MHRPNASFILSAAHPSGFPPQTVPEVAFAGRSNVGKSSLINGLLGVAKLARTSSTPGKTQTVNFFDVDGTARWVDLPGYGYAAVSRRVSSAWRVLVEQFLLSRTTLVMVLVLVDPRHGPTGADLQLIEWLARHCRPFAVVLTKADKLKGSRLNQVRKRCVDAHGVPADRLFSYTTKAPRNVELWNFINAACAGRLARESEAGRGPGDCRARGVL